jgi:hypothetical protein
MKKYYKQGSSIFELDFEKEKMTCITENIFNKGIVISEGMPGPFQSMANSFSSSLSSGVASSGEPLMNSTEEEFKAAFSYAYEIITSASLQV